MALYYVEVYRPPFPSKKRVDFNVYTEANFRVDALSPNMKCVWIVDADGATEAVSKIIEKAAGFDVKASLAFGGASPSEK